MLQQDVIYLFIYFYFVCVCVCVCVWEREITVLDIQGNKKYF